MPQTIPPCYSIGAVAARYGLPTWKVRRAIVRGFLAEPARVGPCRVFTPEQLPAVEDALRRAGYLLAQEVPDK